MTININKHINAPLFVPVDFCSPERACQMLGITLDDLWHFCYQGYLPIYIYTFSLSASGDWCFGNDRKVEVKKGFFASTSHNSIYGYWRVTYADLQPNKDNLFNIDREGVYLTCEAVDIASSDLLECSLNAPLVDGKSGFLEVAINAVQFILFGDDLRDIHSAIYNATPLTKKVSSFSIDNDNQPSLEETRTSPSLEVPRKSREQVEHIALIDRLIRAHPDLDNELLNSPSQLHKALGEMFASKALSYPVKSARTYSRWFKSPSDS